MEALIGTHGRGRLMMEAGIEPKAYAHLDSYPDEDVHRGDATCARISHRPRSCE